MASSLLFLLLSPWQRASLGSTNRKGPLCPEKAWVGGWGRGIGGGEQSREVGLLGDLRTQPGGQKRRRLQGPMGLASRGAKTWGSWATAPDRRLGPWSPRSSG